MFNVLRHDLNSGIHRTVGNHDDVANLCWTFWGNLSSDYWRFEQKNKSWDMCPEKSMVYSGLVGAEVESISLRRNHLAVGIGTSVNIYDLRDSNEPLEI